MGFVVDNPYINGDKGPKKVLRLGLDIPLKDARKGFIFGYGNRHAVDISMDVGDTRISSTHFRVYFDKQSYFLYLEDKSKNGLSVNGVNIHCQSQRVSPGQIIACASVTFELSFPSRRLTTEMMYEKVVSYVDGLKDGPSARALQRLGPYMIAGEQEGRGSSGTVYRVFRENSNVLWAAKQVEATSADRVREEAEILTFLRHRHVVSIHEWLPPILNFGPNPWIIIDYAPHGTLLQYSRSHEISQVLIYKILHQVLLALRYMHSKEIIHGHISPKSILVMAQWPDLSIKLSDFGMSAQSLEDAPEYTAPEMMQEVPDRTTAIDIWATGSVALNAQRQFEEAPMTEILLPRSGERLIGQMVDYIPANRPSAKECVACPIFESKHEDRNEILDMFQLEWFRDFSPSLLKQQLRVESGNSQESFSAPYEFYQNRLIEMYTTEEHEEMGTLEEYGSDAYYAVTDSQLLTMKLKGFGENEDDVRRRVLTLLVFLDRMPYHPQQVRKEWMDLFKRQSCAVALALLEAPEDERYDLHEAYRFRPEFRCWFYTPLVFSGHGHLQERGENHIAEMKKDIEERGDDAAVLFLQTFDEVYEAAKIAATIDTSKPTTKGTAKTVAFNGMVEQKAKEDGAVNLEPLKKTPE